MRFDVVVGGGFARSLPACICLYSAGGLEEGAMDDEGGRDGAERGERRELGSMSMSMLVGVEFLRCFGVLCKYVRAAK